MLDRPVDRLIIAKLEMQEGDLLSATPVATVEAILANEVERACNRPRTAEGKEKQDRVPQAFTDELEKLAEENGIEAVEGCTLVMLRSRQY